MSEIGRNISALNPYADAIDGLDIIADDLDIAGRGNFALRPDAGYQNAKRVGCGSVASHRIIGNQAGRASKPTIIGGVAEIISEIVGHHELLTGGSGNKIIAGITIAMINPESRYIMHADCMDVYISGQ